MPAQDSLPLPDAAAHATQLDFMDLLGYIYLQHGLPDKAAVLLAARDVLAPGSAQCLLTLAVAQVRSSKPHKALETLERLAMLGQMDAHFHLVRAQALYASGQLEAAESAMRAHVQMRQVQHLPAGGAAAPQPGTQPLGEDI